MYTNSLNTFIADLPKIDLHCHLDGSLNTSFIENALHLEHSANLIDKLQVPMDCPSLTEYLKCFDLPVKSLQTKDNISAAVYELIENVSLENTKYIEIRFAPTLSLSENLNYHDILEAAVNGCNLGLKKFGIHSNIIVCAMRHHDIETNLKMLHASMDFYKNGVCALDLAGDESSFSNEIFVDLFRTAQGYQIPFTIHSGECGSVNNIKLAVEMGASRIGHGIALTKDVNLMSEIKKKRIGIELCPTSNYQTKAVKGNEMYPLNTFMENNILATINTDNRTVSNTNITNEFGLITNRFNIKEEDLVTLTKNSIEISFANDNIKNDLLKLL